MNTENKTALVVGASGLVGQSLVKLLISDAHYTKIKLLVRKELPVNHPKIEQLITDFTNLETLNLTANEVFCTLGTTMKKAGSKEAFKQVDLDYPLAVARAAKAAGASVYAIVTALGANKKSAIFYNQVKGEVEDELKQMAFDSLGIFQPSMLLGDRKEGRLGEKVGQIVMSWIDFLTPRQYKAIHVDKVAAAMLKYANNPPKGITVVQSGEMNM